MRKFLILALAVILALGMMGGAFAYFTDTETSSGNTFTAGTLDLQIKDNGSEPDPWGDGVDLTWVMTNMVPGGDLVANHVYLRNVGSIAADHVEISFTNEINDLVDIDVDSDTDPFSDPEDLAQYIEIRSLSYADHPLEDDIILLTTGWDFNGNGWLDLDDVARSPVINADGGPLDDLSPPYDEFGLSFNMTLYFRPEADNDIQGDVLTTTVTFTLNQHASQ